MSCVAKGLGRGTEGATETAPHSLTITEAGLASNFLDWQPALLEHEPGDLEAEILNRLCRRKAGLCPEHSTKFTLTLVLGWEATQWASLMLGQQPALGTPWNSFAGVAVYAPWKLVVWWMPCDAQAPQVFRRAGLLAIAGGHCIRPHRHRGNRLAEPSPEFQNYLRLGPLGGLVGCRNAGLLAQRGVVLGLFDERLCFRHHLGATTHADARSESKLVGSVDGFSLA